MLRFLYFICLSFVLCFVLPTNVYSQCGSIIDLTTWQQAGDPSLIWTVNASGTSVNQSINNGVGYFLSPQDFINVKFTGKLRVDDVLDNDFVGFVVGHRDPFGNTLANVDNNVFYWKKEFELPMLCQTTFAHIEGTNFNDANFWLQAPPNAGSQFDILDCNPGYPGWVVGQTYEFECYYTNHNTTIVIDGDTVINADGCFKPGRFGFFNLSQNKATYSDFTYELLGAFDMSSDSICLGEQTDINVFCDPSLISPYQTLNWYMDDGTVIADSTKFSHTFLTPGTHEIKMVFSDAYGCSDSASKFVHVYSPSLGLGTDTLICDAATFTISPQTDDVSTLYWSTGEIDTAVTVNTSGTYWVTGTNSIGCIVQDTIDVQLGMLNVNYSVVNACANNDVVFTNNTISSVGVTQTLWDFGDGNISNSQSPIHSYDTSGTYTIQLYVENTAGCKDSMQQLLPIFPTPNALFTTQNICANDTALFVDGSSINTGAISSVKWFFGDGDSSSVLNPKHFYANDGVYDVELHVLSDSGCVGVSQQQLTVSPAPTAVFSVNPVCLNDSAQFISTSGSIAGSTTYSWSMGNGATSNGAVVNYQYNNQTTYVVSLTVENNYGCIDSTDAAYTPLAVPDAGFVHVPHCVAQEFIDTSSHNGTISEWIWHFGDGDSATTGNAFHEYLQNGPFDVVLQVEGSNGCTDTSSLTINGLDRAFPAFTSDSVCVGNTTQFVNTSNFSGVTVNYTWNYGDGSSAYITEQDHLYADTGMYQVDLIAITGDGCIDTVSQEVAVMAYPKANFTIDRACLYDSVQFTNTTNTFGANNTSYSWNMGNGTISNQTDVTTIYSSTAYYSIELIATSSLGCSDTISRLYNAYDVPEVSFSAANSCVSDVVSFTNNSFVSSGDSIITSIWNFNDGGLFDTNFDPIRVFHQHGTFDVQLIITSINNCVNDTIIPVTISAKPQMTFLPSISCEFGAPTVFNNTSTIASDSIETTKWTFGDGGLSTDFSPTHQYPQAGVYTVKLIGLSLSGCTDTLLQQVTVLEAPEAKFTSTNTIGCGPVCANFYDSSASNATQIDFWYWEFENGQVSVEQNPQICFNNTDPDSNAYYDARLIVINDLGCRDTVDVVDAVTVFNSPVAAFTYSPETIDTYMDSIYFNNTSQGAMISDWRFCSGDVSSLVNPTIAVPEVGFCEASLVVTSNKGCKDSTAVEIEVRPVFSLYVPNSFTPNGDGVNDTFFFKGEAITDDKFEFSIYNRWGELIYYTQHLKPWDGTYLDEPVTQDTFTYTMVYKDLDGVLQEKVGRFMLLRE